MLRLPHVGRTVARAAKGSLAPFTTGNVHRIFKFFSSTFIFSYIVIDIVFILLLRIVFTIVLNQFVRVPLIVNILCLLVISSFSTGVRAASNMVEVFVDGKPVAVEPGTTVLQVTKQCIILAMLWFYCFML